MKGRLHAKQRALAPIEVYEKVRKSKKEEELLRNRAREAMTQAEYFAVLEQEKEEAIGGWNDSASEHFKAACEGQFLPKYEESEAYYKDLSDTWFGEEIEEQS